MDNHSPQLSSKIPASLLLLLALVMAAPWLSAQNKEFRLAEDSLKSLLYNVHRGENDQVKYESNQKLLKYFASVLEDERSFKYPFDSLTHMARLTSPDESFRILNWNLPLENGTHEYFGFIQVRGNKDFPYRVYSLSDHSHEIESPEFMVLPHDRWYGALYYKVIHSRIKDKDYYTLLAWDGNNLLSTKKLIDVLSFKSNGKPQFGASIFRKYKDKDKNVRIIFEYSARTTMVLRYESQYLHVITQSKDKKNRKVKTRLETMILFDNLVPMDHRLSDNHPDLTGQYQFYVPETNVLNGFILKEGRWYFTKDVDARNPPPPKKKKRPAPPKSGNQ